MTKFKTLRGLAGYLVRQEGKMTAKKSRAKIGDTMQMLGVLSDLFFQQSLQDNPTLPADELYEYIIRNDDNGDVDSVILYEGAKRWKRAQKGKKK